MPNTPILPEEQTPAIPKSKRILMEDVNVVRLEGRYFCFNGRDAAKRINATLTFENANGSAVAVETGKRGQPSVLAYRLLQAIFRQITLCGRPYPSQVAFTRRELGRLIGRESFGGRDAQDILRALYQMQDTFITLHGNTGKSHVTDNRFNLLVQVYSIWEKDEHALRRQGALDAIAIELHPAVMRNIAEGQIAIFNWPVLEQLEPLQAALYKRLYLTFSSLYEMQGQKPHTLIFEKAYTAICEEWLGGLQRYRFKSDIAKQLMPHLTPLIETRLIKDVQIEPLSKGEGFKLRFKPGQGFFADYEQFFRLKLVKRQDAKDAPSKPAPLPSDMQQPIALVQQFYKSAKGTEIAETSLAKGDITYAEELITQFGIDNAKEFISYGLSRARKTHFQIASFRGLKIYAVEWQTEQIKRARQSRRETADQNAKQKEDMKAAYEAFQTAHAEAYLASLAEAARVEITAEAESYVRDTYGEGRSFHLMVKNQLRNRALALSPIPDLETWVSMQRRLATLATSQQA